MHISEVELCLLLRLLVSLEVYFKLFRYPGATNQCCLYPGSQWVLLLLQRFGVADIKQHPWFLEDLPDGALDMNNTLMQQAHSLDEVGNLPQ